MKTQRKRTKKSSNLVLKKLLTTSTPIKLLLLFSIVCVLAIVLSFFQTLITTNQDLRSQAQSVGECQSQPGGACGRGVDCCGSTADPNHGNLGLACSIRNNFVGTCDPYNGGVAGMGANCSCPAVDLNGDGVADYRDYNFFGDRCVGKPFGWSDGQVTCFDYDGNGLVGSNGRGADNDMPCLMSCIDSYRPSTCDSRQTQADCEGGSAAVGPECQWFAECNLCDDLQNAAIPGSGSGCNGVAGMGQAISVTPTRMPNRPACSSVGSAGGLSSYCYESSWCGGGTHTCIYNTYDCSATECCCVPNDLAPAPVACRGVGSSCDATVGMCCSGLWCESGTCIDPIAAGLHNPPPTGRSAQPTGSDPTNSQPTPIQPVADGLTPTPSVSPETLEDFMQLLSNQNLLELFIQFLRGLMGNGGQQ